MSAPPSSSSEAFHVDWSRFSETPTDDVRQAILDLVQPGQREYYEAELKRIDPKPGLENVMSKYNLTANEAYAVWSLSIPAPRGAVDASPLTQLNYMLNTRAASERQNHFLLMFYCHLRRGLQKLPSKAPQKLYYGLGQGTIYNAVYREGAVVFWPSVVLVRDQAKAYLEPGSNTSTLIILRRPSTAYDISGVSRRAFEKQRALLPNTSIKVVRILSSEEASDVLNIADKSFVEGEEDEEEAEDEPRMSADVVVSDCAKLLPADKDDYDPVAAKAAKAQRLQREKEAAAAEKAAAKDEKANKAALPDQKMLITIAALRQTSLSAVVRMKVAQIDNGALSIKAAEGFVKELMEAKFLCGAYRLVKSILRRASRESNTSTSVWSRLLEFVLPLCGGVFGESVDAVASLNTAQLDGVMLHLFLDASGVAVNAGLTVSAEAKDSSDRDKEMMDLISASLRDHRSITTKRSIASSTQSEGVPDSPSFIFLQSYIEPLVRYLHSIEAYEEISRAQAIHVNDSTDLAKVTKYFSDSSGQGAEEVARRQRLVDGSAQELTRATEALVGGLVDQLCDLSMAASIAVEKQATPGASYRTVIIPLGCRDEPNAAYSAAIVTVSASNPATACWTHVCGGAAFHAAHVHPAEGCAQSTVLVIDRVPWDVILDPTFISHCVHFRLDGWPSPSMCAPAKKTQATFHRSILSRLGGQVMSESSLPRSLFAVSPQTPAGQAALVTTSVIKYLALLRTRQQLSEGGGEETNYEALWSACLSKLYYFVGSSLQVRFSGMNDDHQKKPHFRAVLRGVAQYGAARALSVLNSGNPAKRSDDSDFALSMASLAWDASQLDAADAKKQLAPNNALLAMVPVPFECFSCDWFSMQVVLGKGANADHDKQKHNVKGDNKGDASKSKKKGKVQGSPMRPIHKSLHLRVWDGDAVTEHKHASPTNVAAAFEALKAFLEEPLHATLSEYGRIHEHTRSVESTIFVLSSLAACATDVSSYSDALTYKLTSNQLDLVESMKRVLTLFFNASFALIQETTGKRNEQSTTDLLTGATVSWRDDFHFTNRYVVCYHIYLLIYLASRNANLLGDFLRLATPVPPRPRRDLISTSRAVQRLADTNVILFTELSAAVASEEKNFTAFEYMTKNPTGGKLDVDVSDPHVVALMSGGLLRAEVVDQYKRYGALTRDTILKIILTEGDVRNRESASFVAFRDLREATQYAWHCRSYCTHNFKQKTGEEETEREAKLSCTECPAPHSSAVSQIALVSSAEAEVNNAYADFFNRDPLTHTDNKTITSFRNGNRTSWNLPRYTRVRSIRSERLLFLDRLAMAVLHNDVAFEIVEEALLVTDLLVELHSAALDSELRLAYGLPGNLDRMDSIVAGLCQVCVDGRLTDRKVAALRNVVRCLTLLLACDALVTAEHRRRIEEALHKARQTVGQFLLADASEGDVKPKLLVECSAVVLMSLRNQDISKLLAVDETATGDAQRVVTFIVRARFLIELAINQYHGEVFLPRWLFAECMEVFSQLEHPMMSFINENHVHFDRSGVAPSPSIGAWTGIRRVLSIRYPQHMESFADLEQKYKRSESRLYRSLLVGWRGKDPSQLQTAGERVLSLATGVGGTPEDGELADAEPTEAVTGEDDALKQMPTTLFTSIAEDDILLPASVAPPLSLHTLAEPNAWYYSSTDRRFHRNEIAFDPLTGVIESENPLPTNLDKNPTYALLVGKNPSSHPVLSPHAKGFVAKHPFQPATHTFADGVVQLRHEASAAARQWHLLLYVQTVANGATAENPIFYERFVAADDKAIKGSKNKWHRFLPSPPKQIDWVKHLSQRKEAFLHFYDESTRSILIKNLDRQVRFVFDVDRRWMLTVAQEQPWSPFVVRDVVFPLASLPQHQQPALFRIVGSLGCVRSSFLFVPHDSVRRARVSRILPTRLQLVEMGLSWTIDTANGLLQCDHVNGSFLKVSQDIPQLSSAKNGLLMIPRESRLEQMDGVTADDVIAFPGYYNHAFLPAHFVYRRARESGLLVSSSAVGKIFLAKLFWDTARQDKSIAAYQSAVALLRQCEQNSPFGISEYELLKQCFLLPPGFTDDLKSRLMKLSASRGALQALPELWAQSSAAVPDASRHFAALWLWAFFVAHRSLTLAPLYRSDDNIKSATELVDALARTLLPHFLYEYSVQLPAVDAKCRLTDDAHGALLQLVVHGWETLREASTDGGPAAAAWLASQLPEDQWSNSQPLLWLASLLYNATSGSDDGGDARMIPVGHNLCSGWMLCVGVLSTTDGDSFPNMKANLQKAFFSSRPNLRLVVQNHGVMETINHADRFLCYYDTLLKWYDDSPLSERRRSDVYFLQMFLSSEWCVELRSDTAHSAWASCLMLIACGLAASAESGDEESAIKKSKQQRRKLASEAVNNDASEDQRESNIRKDIRKDKDAEVLMKSRVRQKGKKVALKKLSVIAEEDETAYDELADGTEQKLSEARAAAGAEPVTDDIIPSNEGSSAATPKYATLRDAIPDLETDDLRTALEFITKNRRQFSKKFDDFFCDLSISAEQRLQFFREAFARVYSKNNVGQEKALHEYALFKTSVIDPVTRSVRHTIPELCTGNINIPVSVKDKSSTASVRSLCIEHRLNMDWSAMITERIPAAIEYLWADARVQQKWTAMLQLRSASGDVRVTIGGGERCSAACEPPSHVVPSHPSHIDVMKQNAESLRAEQKSFIASIDRWIVPNNKDVETMAFPLHSAHEDSMTAEYSSNFAAQFLERLHKSFVDYSAKPRTAYTLDVPLDQLHRYLKEHIVRASEACNFARQSIANLLWFTPDAGAWPVRCEYILQRRTRCTVAELLQALSFNEPTPGDKVPAHIAKLEAELQAARQRSKGNLSEEEEEDVMALLSSLKRQIQSAKDAALLQVADASAPNRQAVYASLNTFLDETALAVMDELVIGYLDLFTLSQQARRGLTLLSQLRRLVEQTVTTSSQRDDDDAATLLEQDLAVTLTTRPHPISDAWALYRIFELENNLRIRALQFELCQRLVEVARRPNSPAIMYQLFMGDGKTTVILPILVAVLSSRADAVMTVTVPEALITSTANVLKERFDGSIPKQVLQLPFNRTLPPSVQQLADALAVIKQELLACMQRRNILLQSPEHRLCFELRYYEVLLECLHIDSAQEAPSMDVNSVAVECNISAAIAEEFTQVVKELHYLTDEGMVNDCIPATLIEFYNAVNGRAYPSNFVTAMFHHLSRRAGAHCKAVRRCRELFEEIRDIPRIHVLDESDDILRYGSELHYSVGAKAPLHPERFEAAFMLVRLVLADSEVHSLLSAALRDGETATLTFQRHVGAADAIPVPTVRWASGEAPSFTLGGVKMSLQEYLAQRVVQKLDDDVFGSAAAKSARSASLAAFLSGKDAELSVPITSQRALLFTIRGWLACGVLDHVFSKRHRVDYGIDLKRKGGNGVAVPFRGSEIASDRAQFAHPDVLIGFTLVSYMYQGLNLLQTRALLKLAVDSYRAQLREWLKSAISVYKTREATSELPDHVKSAMDRFDGDGDLPDVHDINDVRSAHVLLRHHVDAVWCYLINVLLPTETMQYPEKISGNGCHIAAPPHTVGFSGTDDTRDTMPHRVQCLPFEPVIHGKMLHIAARKKNSHAVGLTYVTGSEYLAQVVGMVAASRKSSNPIHVLIDAGAVCCGLTNRQVVDFLMSRPEMQELFEGCIYCDDDTGGLVVYVRAGRAVMPISSSQIPPSMLFCFLDDVHTRGIDVKFPPKATGIVTVGENMEKDKLMQAVMRLRQLDNGQRFVLHMHETLAKTIASFNGLPSIEHLATSNVLRWVTWNTLLHLRRDFPSAIVQNIQHIAHQTSLDFQRKSRVAIPHFVSRLKTEVQHDAESLYGGKRVPRFTQHFLQERRHKICNPLWNDVTKVSKDLFTFSDSATAAPANHDTPATPSLTFEAFVKIKLEQNNSLLDALDTRAKRLLQASDTILVGDGPDASEEQEQECQVEIEIEQVREEVKHESSLSAIPLPPQPSLDVSELHSYSDVVAAVGRGFLVSCNAALHAAGFVDAASLLRFPRDVYVTKDFAESVTANSADPTFYFKCPDYAVILDYDSDDSDVPHNGRCVTILLSSHDTACCLRAAVLLRDIPVKLRAVLLVKMDAHQKFCSFGTRLVFERQDVSPVSVNHILGNAVDSLTAAKLLCGECNAYDSAAVELLKHQLVFIRTSDLEHFGRVYLSDDKRDATLHLLQRYSALIPLHDMGDNSAEVHASQLLDMLSIAAQVGLIMATGQPTHQLLASVSPDGSLQPQALVAKLRGRVTARTIDDFIGLLEWYLFFDPLDNGENSVRQAASQRTAHIATLTSLPHTVKSFVCFFRGRHDEFRGSVLERVLAVKE